MGRLETIRRRADSLALRSTYLKSLLPYMHRSSPNIAWSRTRTAGIVE